MKEKLKELLGIAKPGGLDDLAIRALKSALAAFAAFVIKEGLGNLDHTAAAAAIDAGWVAGATVVLNAMLLLAPGDPGQKTGDDEAVDADAPNALDVRRAVQESPPSV
jgi:hypothetical protein